MDVLGRERGAFLEVWIRGERRHEETRRKGRTYMDKINTNMPQLEALKGKTLRQAIIFYSVFCFVFERCLLPGNHETNYLHCLKHLLVCYLRIDYCCYVAHNVFCSFVIMNPSSVTSPAKQLNFGLRRILICFSGIGSTFPLIHIASALFLLFMFPVSSKEFLA